MDEKKFKEIINKNLLPAIEKMLENNRDFNFFFNNLKKINVITDCEVESSLQPNPATDNGHYPNQNFLQFIYKDKVINFDLNDGTILDDKFAIIEDSAVCQTLYNRTNNLKIDYTKEELEKVYNSINSKLVPFKNLKFQRNNLTSEEFKKLLEDDYNVIFSSDEIFIEEDNYRLFLKVDLDNHEVILTNQVSFFKDDSWQDPIDIEQELMNVSRKKSGQEDAS